MLREVTGGVTRCDAIQRSLGISRRALTERLAGLVEDGVLIRAPYAERPPLRLSPHCQGRRPHPGVACAAGVRRPTCDGDGSLTATAAASSGEAQRVHNLVGSRMPEVTLASHRGEAVPLLPSRAGGSSTSSLAHGPPTAPATPPAGVPFRVPPAARWNRRRTPPTTKSSRRWGPA